jgi:hypothetical protein
MAQSDAAHLPESAATDLLARANAMGKAPSVTPWWNWRQEGWGKDMVTRMTVWSRKALLTGLVVALAVLAALAWSTMEPDGARASLKSTAPDNAEWGRALVNGWEFIGKPRWFPLSNHYYAAGLYAINRTSRPLSTHLKVVLFAEYENAPGKFEGLCDAVDVSGKTPTDSAEIFWAAQEPPGDKIRPGGRTYVACFQVSGGVPDPEDMPKPASSLQIDSSTASFEAY